MDHDSSVHIVSVLDQGKSVVFDAPYQEGGVLDELIPFKYIPSISQIPEMRYVHLHLNLHSLTSQPLFLAEQACLERSTQFSLE